MNLCGCRGLEYPEVFCCKQNADIVCRKESGDIEKHLEKGNFGGRETSEQPREFSTYEVISV